MTRDAYTVYLSTWAMVRHLAQGNTGGASFKPRANPQTWFALEHIQSGRIVGCTSILHMSPTHGRVSNLFVCEAHRGHGCGTKLVKAATQYAFFRGADTVSARSKEQLFGKLGFNAVKTYKGGFEWSKLRTQGRKP